MSSILTQNIVFVGAGSMAEAIIRGLVQHLHINPQHIHALNRQNKERLQQLGSEYGIQTGHVTAQQETLQKANIIVLAMKPKDAKKAITELAPLLNPKQFLISVIAGLSIKSIGSSLSADIPVVRTMPNTSSTIGLGATGISVSSHVTQQQLEWVLQCFQSIGCTALVAEEQLDLITGLSGSGPAYIYYMMEAMIEAAVQDGLEERIAKEFAVQTVLGAATMVKETGEEPSALRKKVMSPGGTTEAAIAVMDQKRFADIVQSAMRRSAQRATEIGKSLE